jgi:hypothetical protein
MGEVATQEQELRDAVAAGKFTLDACIGIELKD